MVELVGRGDLQAAPDSHCSPRMRSSWPPPSGQAPGARARAGNRPIHFTPLNATDGTLIDLGAFTGVRGMDCGRDVATIGAGTPLWDVGPALFSLGYGFKNMGDIDRQTLAGVVSTGTHGTGESLGSFSGRRGRLPPDAGDRRHHRLHADPKTPRSSRPAACRLGHVRRPDRNLHACAPGLQARRKELPDVGPTKPSRSSMRSSPRNRHFEFLLVFPYADNVIPAPNR